MFSKIPVASQLTQPAMLEICHASGSAVATTPAPMVPSAHSQMPIAAVPVSSIAFITASANMNFEMSCMCAASAPWCSSTISRT
ncbi:hypothetical protein D3C83_72350 [compost metagenome]